jgi:hypothetical protein
VFLVADTTQVATAAQVPSRRLGWAPPADRAWVSVHLFHQGSADVLLRELVAPTVAELRPRLASHFFLRHWQGGPHVRLRLLPATPEHAAVVRAAVLRAARRFFAVHPSATTLSADAYEQLVQHLSRIEPDLERVPLHATDKAALIDYVPEHHKYGDGAALSATERHFRDSSELALDALQRDMTPAQRRVLALQAIFATAGVAGDAATALRRGAENWSRIAGPANRRAAEIYARNGDHLRQARSRQDDPMVAAWQRSISDLRGVLVELRGPATPLVLDACTHLLCNRLGVALHEESVLRSLAALIATDLLEEHR